MRTHYEVLGVSAEAEDIVIDAAYRALMKRHHPDIQGAASEARAKEINEAYRVLKDAGERARYDRTLGANRTSPPPRSPSPSRQSPPPPPAPSQAPAPRELAGKITPASWVFIGLAVLVIVGAIGSLGAGGTPSSEAAPAADTVAAAPTAAPDEAGPRTRPVPVSEPASLPEEPALATGNVEPSFDCRRADTEVLRMICLIPDLAAADAKLAAAYQEAMQASDQPALVREAQRDWLRQRDELAADPQVLLAHYRARLSDLASVGKDEPIY